MPRTFLLVVLLLLGAWALGAPAYADALDAEYASMRAVPGATRDVGRCGCDPCGSRRRGWSWRVALMSWLPGVDGTTVVGGQEADVDFAWTDWFDSLDKVDFVLQGQVAVHHDRWFLEATGLRMVLGDSVPLETPGPLPVSGRLDAELTVAAVKGVVGYDVATTRLSRCSCCPAITWSAYAGVRWYHVGVEANLVGPNAQVRVLDEDEDWLDPLVGGRARCTFSRRWTVFLEADVGGFGVGSDLAWHVAGGAEWRLTRWLALQGGWNGLDVDYSSGSGDDRFVFDLTLSGPFVALVFLF